MPGPQRHLQSTAPSSCESLPQGWAPNKPAYRDNEGKVALTGVPDLETAAVPMTSCTRAMHLYCGKRFAAQEGERVVVNCLMRGDTAGSPGVYFHPAGGWLKKGFAVSEDWSELSSELALGPGIESISVVMGIPPCASVEFLDITARIIRTWRQ